MLQSSQLRGRKTPISFNLLLVFLSRLENLRMLLLVHDVLNSRTKLGEFRYLYMIKYVATLSLSLSKVWVTVRPPGGHLATY